LSAELEKRLKDEIEGGLPFEFAYKSAVGELNLCRRYVLAHSFQMVADTRHSESSNKVGMGQVYEQLLKAGKERKLCTACNRGINAEEMVVFEKYVRDVMRVLHERHLLSVIVYSSRNKSRSTLLKPSRRRRSNLSDGRRNSRSYRALCL
jgi:hypothetical protein